MSVQSSIALKPTNQPKIPQAIQLLGKNRDCNTEIYPIDGKLHMTAWWEWCFPNSMCFKSSG